MLIDCKNCGAKIEDCDIRCPKCGQVNKMNEPQENSKPKTIEELKKWYISRELPNEEITRFYIDKNIQEPKAFGIYRDEYVGNYIVYKNKEDGSRSIRYEGNDEEVAVNEFYMRLLEEIRNQNYHIKSNVSNLSEKIPIEDFTEGNSFSNALYNAGESLKNSSSTILKWIIITIATLFLIGIVDMIKRKNRNGNYYEDDYYYKKSYYDSETSSRKDYGDSSSSWSSSSSSWDSSSTDWSSDW